MLAVRGFFYAIAVLTTLYTFENRAVAFHRGGGCHGGQAQAAGCRGVTAGCQGNHGSGGLFGGRFVHRERYTVRQRGFSSAPVVAPANPPRPMPSSCRGGVCPATSQVAGNNLVSVTNASALDALGEVNATRARRGLQPFIFDGGLARAAMACAEFRATRRIRGHTSNDFGFLDGSSAATATGAGALEASWGFQACCVTDNFTYAGAASAQGPDGLWYHSIFVR